MTDSESIIRELVEMHGINSITVPCPVCHPMHLSDCNVCGGTGKVQYGIDNVEFFS